MPVVAPAPAFTPVPAAAAVPRFHGPVNDLQRWAEHGLQVLCGSDPDRAKERNDVGFNQRDGEFGHDLAGQLESGKGLSDPQWAAAVRMLAKYHRQIGAPPSGVGKNPADYWHVIVSEPVAGKKATLGVFGPDDARVWTYAGRGGATVQRFELDKRYFEAEEAAEWARVQGIKWLRVEG